MPADHRPPASPPSDRPGARPGARAVARWTAALAVLWLAAGAVNVGRGAAHAGAGYRFWAFQHHAYSDILALHGDRYLGGGRPRPYLDDRIEYPVLLGAALFLPALAPGGSNPLVHFLVSYAFLACCLFAALVALGRTPGAAPWWLGATPALAYYAGLNWDLLPIALLALAAAALARPGGGRAGTAGALSALGVSAKLFPAVLVPPALAALAAGLARGPAPGHALFEARRPLLRFALAFVAVVLAVNLPVALAAPDNWAWFFRFNVGRGAENSLWDALGLAKGPLLETLSTGPLVLATGFASAVAFLAARRGGDGLRVARLGAAAALVAWIATNKIWSPQYALYGFLAGAWAAAPLPAFLGLTALSVADFHVAFEVRALRWEPWFRDHVFHPMGVLRSLAWLGLALWIAREAWRAVSPRAGAASGSGAARPGT